MSESAAPQAPQAPKNDLAELLFALDNARTKMGTGNENRRLLERSMRTIVALVEEVGRLRKMVSDADEARTALVLPASFQRQPGNPAIIVPRLR